MGATTAECLRDLLFKGMEPLDFYRYPPNSKRERIEREELRKIKEKLDAAGIKTRPIFWNESDRASPAGRVTRLRRTGTISMSTTRK